MKAMVHWTFNKALKQCYLMLQKNYVTSSKTCYLPVQTTNVPTMGDSMTEGTIVDIPVGPGDYAEADDVVIVLETDKVSADARANESGKIVDMKINFSKSVIFL